MYSADTSKSNGQFIQDLTAAVKKHGFIIQNEDKMAMASSFGAHGVDVADDFDLHMIQLCKPQKAAISLQINPERSILMPKFIMTFTQDNKTQIRFLRFSEENIKSLVDDQLFPASLTETYEKIIEIIEEAK